jgi:hypothetical protein
MKYIGLIILTLFLIYSCTDKSTKENKRKTNEVSVPAKSGKESLTNNGEKPDNSETISNPELTEMFAKAVQCFPNDSVSLHRFYFKWNPTNDQNKINKQVIRLKKLTSKESVEKYISVEKNLKPLLTEIVNSDTIIKSQSDSLVKLYSDYDYFSGESLFSQLITNDENYNLVWQSFRIMAKESSIDTCFISDLIKLENNIRTNAELSEAMGGFVVKAIHKNPIGFLEMYNHRQAEQRTNFANYITIWDEPDKELIDKYSEISKNSINEKYRQLATELIGKFKN